MGMGMGMGMGLWNWDCYCENVQRKRCNMEQTGEPRTWPKSYTFPSMGWFNFYLLI